MDKKLRQGRPFPWKWFLVLTVAGLLVVAFFVEYFQIALFFSAIFAITALGMWAGAWRDVRRKRKTQENLETLREEARQKEISLRREACREARYYPEERELLEAHIEKNLGPVQSWDLEEDGDVLRLDAALIPPTEALPYWKAATVGAGAYTLEAGGYVINSFRAELVMALPPDWDPGERWPVQVLRDAVRRFLVAEGFVGYGSVYRGFSLINAGFAGAVAADDLPGLPDLGLAAMLSAPGVTFFWLVPLLKPEMEYFQRRGLAGLDRRFPEESPWADPSRRPLAEPLTWLQEDIAPFAWSEEDGLYCLGMNIGDWQKELFAQAGYTNLTWGWEKLARVYLRRSCPNDLPFVEFACEDGVFFAASRDREIMERLALGLSDLLRQQPHVAFRMLTQDQL